MDLLTLTVLGDPVPKGRPRSGTGRFYTPKRTVDAEKRIRAAAMAAYPLPVPWDDPVGIEVNFFCATRRRTDGDNLMKLVTDALQRERKADTGGVIMDDAQIEEWHCRVHRREAGEEPRTEIRIFALTKLLP